jgi:mannosyltransferase OCH1-like enzyme
MIKTYKKYKKSRKRKTTKKKHFIQQRGAGDDIKDVNIEHFIGKTHKDSPNHINGVPLVIYQHWHTHNIPIHMKDTIDKRIRMTPEFDNYFFSDDESLKFIQDNFEPNVASAFKSLKPSVYQSDLWRYCILYKKGGVYIDIKMELHLPLIDILK